MRTIPYLRWGIAGMLFLAAMLNYLDRQVLSLLALTIQKDLSLSEIDYGHITSGFLIAYTVSLLIAGRLVDRIGVRLGLAIFVTWWSLANMAHAFARSFTSLAACQVLLGLGEAGNWPSSTKVVSEWFPAKERAFAIGLYTMGATLGATIAPILILSLASGGSNWGNAFLVTGVAGLCWVLPWLWLYRKPSEHPRITPEEKALTDAIAAGAPAAPAGTELGEGQRWKAVLMRREVWLLLIARMLTDPAWYFYQFWFAKYLAKDRDVAQADLGITWLVFLAADLGCLLGGFLSAWYIRRGQPAASARLKAMMLCALLPPLSALLPFAPSMWMCLAIAMLVVFAHLMWLANITALLVDVVPQRLVGTAFGVVAAGSTIGGVMMNQTVGRLVTDHSYAAWFILAACLHPIAWMVLRLGRVHRSAIPTT
jgi:ACS family hexuronate transporter-like MFS transporter